MQEIENLINDLISFYDICFYVTSNTSLKQKIKYYLNKYKKVFPKRRYKIVNTALLELNLHMRKDVDAKIINECLNKLVEILEVLETQETKKNNLLIKLVVDNINDFKIK